VEISGDSVTSAYDTNPVELDSVVVDVVIDVIDIAVVVCVVDVVEDREQPVEKRELNPLAIESPNSRLVM
jgi:hypothetical protein